MKVCPCCNTQFEENINQIYCSKRCRNKNYMKGYKQNHKEKYLQQKLQWRIRQGCQMV